MSTENPSVSQLTAPLSTSGGTSASKPLHSAKSASDGEHSFKRSASNEAPSASTLAKKKKKEKYEKETSSLTGTVRLLDARSVDIYLRRVLNIVIPDQALILTQTGVESSFPDLLQLTCAPPMGSSATHALLVYLLSDVDVDAVDDA
ncbi:UNVERIFIED_CONTAM: hypothetical protein K2H54_001455 [Gekko kuhli]